MVDGPAAGHAITFLTVGRRPARRGARRPGPRPRPTTCVELLGDPERCQVVLVTLPETTPVNELIETAYALEDRVGVRLGPVVVNEVDGLGDRRARPRQPSTSAAPTASRPTLRVAAAAFRRDRRRRCKPAEIARLASELAARSSVHLPLLPVAGLDGRRRRPRWPRRCGRRPDDGPRRRASARRRGHRVLRIGRGRQDDDGGRASGSRRPAAGGGPSWSRSIRRAASPTRSASPTGWPPSRSGSSSPDADRRAVGDDARHAGDVRRRRARATPTDAEQAERILDEPLLPQHRRRAERHAGVHGRRDAARAARRRPLRPRRRRHAAEPQRARLPRGTRRAHPVPRPPAVQAADAADRGAA